ncbi:hypothetical protein [Yinghuangia sp. YIM S09857]
MLSHTGGQSLLEDRRVPHGASLVASGAPVNSGFRMTCMTASPNYP